MMDKDEFAKKMRDIANIGDEEIGHSMADDLLCEALDSLGFTEGVEIFRNMDKWYS